MILKNILIILIAIFIFAGCAAKQEKNAGFNKPAIFWYKNIIKSIKSGDLEKADDYYTSLSSEHVDSPLLKESMMILVHAHSEDEEYLLANYYIDEYTKRFGDSKNIEFLKYLKIKSSFDAFKHQSRDQKLLISTIKNAYEYLDKYPNSKYNPLVYTILTKLHLSEYQLNQEIVSLYKRTGKDKAANIYQEKLNNSWLNSTEIVNPEKNWFKKIFE